MNREVPLRSLADLLREPPARGPHCHGFVNGCVCRHCAARAHAVEWVELQSEIVRGFVDGLRPAGWYPFEICDGRLRVAMEGTSLRVLLPRTPADPTWLRRAEEALTDDVRFPWERAA